ncbi:MAG: hypothetical protein GY790_13565, partial [Bacteroidetes bacterium]|nr:hypothetical protein [Bacteroidota bacterium]
LTHCKKFDVERQWILTTDAVGEITHTTVDVTGSMMDLAGINGKFFGFHWAIHGQEVHPNDTIVLGKPYDSGQFGATLWNLEPGTEYEVWTYVHDGEKEIAAEPIGFRTMDPEPPQVETTRAVPLNPYAIWCHYEVRDDGGIPVTEHGICWNTSDKPDPELEPHSTVVGAGTGYFESLATELLAETEYKIRAYAINLGGITYGNMWNVSTANPELPIIYTLPAIEITSTSAVLRAIFPYVGQSPILLKGICWGSEPGIDFDDNLLEWNGGEGDIEFLITGLSPATVYYFRAFVSWGEEHSPITKWLEEMEFGTLPE